MQQVPVVDLPRELLIVLNQLYEIEIKLKRSGEGLAISRNINKMKDAFEALQLFYEDPMGQVYRETRTDLEAAISGTSTDDLVVVEVLKPILRYGPRSRSIVIQKGIVVAQSKNK